MPENDTRMPLIANALRRQLALLFAVAILVTGAATFYVSQMRSTYTATASVLIKPIPGNPLSQDTATSNGAQLTVAMQTESGLVDIPSVAAAASKTLGRTVPAKGEVVSAEVPPGTQIIRISYVSREPDKARAGAQTFADTFLKYRVERAAAGQKESLDSLKKQAATADANLKKAALEAARSTDKGSYATQQVQLFADRLATLNNSISTAQAVSTDPGTVITAAATPAKTDGVSALIIIGAAAALGLGLGLMLAVWRERREDLVRTESEIDVSGVPVFASLPPATRAGGRGALVTCDGADEKVQEAYRRLRAGVVANGQRPQSIAVSCVSDGERSSLIATNLALTLANAGFRVGLVAADPQDRGIEEALGVPSAPGLADLVSDAADLSRALVFALGITVLPGGTDPAAAREMYAGPRFRMLVNEMTQECDYVLIAAAGAGTADGDAAVAVADSALLVVTNDRTAYHHVTAVLARFHRLGVHVLGGVSAPPARRHNHKHGVATPAAAQKRASKPTRSTRSTRATVSSGSATGVDANV